MIKKLISIVLILSLLLGNFGGYPAFAENKEVSEDFTEWESARVVDKDKIWEIEFNSIIDEDTVTMDNIYIVNELNEVQDVILSIGENNDSIVIYPPKGGYDNSHIYTLYITKNIISIMDNKLASGIIMRFYIEKEDTNEVIFSDDVTVIVPSNIVGITENSIVLESGIEAVAGEIIIIEPSDEYPTGIARKITEVKIINGKTTLITEEPLITDLIDMIDIGGSLDLDLSNIGSEEGLTEGVEAVEYSKYNDSDGRIETGVTFLIDKTETIIEKDEYGEDYPLTVKILGRISLSDSKISVKMADEKEKDSRVGVILTSKVNVGLTIEGEFKGKTEITLAEFNPVLPTVPGLSVEMKIKGIAEVTAKDNLKFIISSTYLLEIGANLEHGKLNRINNSRLIALPSPVVEGYSGLEAKVGIEISIEPQYMTVGFCELKGFAGLGLEVEVQKGEFNIFEFELEAGFKAEVTFQIRISKDLKFTWREKEYGFGLEIGFEEIEIFNEYLGKKIKINNKEKLIGIEIVPPELKEIKVGETKKINVIGIFENNLTKKTRKIDITKDTKLTSSNPGLLSVAKDGTLYSPRLENPILFESIGDEYELYNLPFLEELETIGILSEPKDIRITATFKDKTAYKNIRLLPLGGDLPVGKFELQQIDFINKNIELNKDDIYQIQVKALLKDLIKGRSTSFDITDKVTYTSNSPIDLSISHDGLITITSNSNKTIKVKASYTHEEITKTTEMLVNIVPANNTPPSDQEVLQEVYFLQNNLEIKSGETHQAIVKASFKDINTSKIRTIDITDKVNYLSSSPKDVEIDYNGNVRIIATTFEEVKITASYTKDIVTKKANMILKIIRDENIQPDFLELELQKNKIASGSHTILLDGSGTVWAWGANNYGELGNGTRRSSYSPIKVNGMENIVSVSISDYSSSYALEEDGTLWAWGDNKFGMLGEDDSLQLRSTPAKVKGIENIGQISVSYHIAALDKDGNVWTWGNNEYGQLGDGSTENRSTPAKVEGIENIVSVKVSRLYTVALERDGTVWVWGNNEYLPIKVEGIGYIASILVDLDTIVALEKDGTAWIWGDLSSFIREDRDVTIPVKIDVAGNVSSVSLKWKNIIIVSEDGAVWVWGDNSFGQLGDGTREYRRKPVKVKGIEDIIAVSIDPLHAVALSEDGTVWEWGVDDYNYLGREASISLPKKVGGLENIVLVVATGSHTIALKEDGTVWSWGFNGAGQLGDGTNINSNVPVEVMGINLYR